MCSLDLTARFDTIDSRQLHVHEHQVGEKDAGGHNRVLPRGGLADNLETDRCVDHFSGRPTKGFLVITDQYLHGHATGA